MKFDEFSIGQVFKTNSLQVTKEEIMSFAKEFDPQYMHLDEAKTEQGRFNGIIASGIHTLSISFKLWVEQGIYGEDVIAGTGMDNIKFINPVYPEDKLHVIIEVIRKRKVKKDAGIITVLLSTYNDKAEKVFKGELSALVSR